MPIRGCVERVFHTSGTHNILSFHVMESDSLGVPRMITATGYFFGITRLISGATLEIEGEWARHPKYGRQYKVQRWKPWAKTVMGVALFLGECVDVFSDTALLQKVVSYFGKQTYEVLVGDKVLECTIDEKEREALCIAIERWNNVLGIATLSDFLQSYKLGAFLIAAVFHRFGFDSVEILSQNPYRLVEIEGVTFQRADLLAEQRGIGAGDPRRIAGAVLWVIRDQVRQQGHLFVRRGEVPSLLNDLSIREKTRPFDVPNISTAVEAALIELEKIEAVKIDPGVGIYTPEMYLYERGAAVMLSKFLAPSELIIDLDSFLKDYEKVNDITLSDLQREAVVQLLTHRALVVTGAPGTGKTTLIRTFVQLFRRLNIDYMLMAPTGIASKRLASVTEAAAQTIHRALRYDGFRWGRDNFDQLETQAVIVDEVSMLDMELFYRLLDALDTRTMLVLVGDDAQLPSVGPGNVLRELLACKAVPHIKLEQVFRQAETSDIVLAAHRIRKGASPLDLPSKENSEFRFWRMSDENEIAELVVKMAAKLKSRDANFQILSPKYDGVVGVNNLNTLLRDQLNPDKGQPTWELADFFVRVGDRLMVIKNDYKLNIYNGDIGKLIEINRDSLVLRIHGVGTIPDAKVSIPKDQAGLMLKLAYAVTVHRCQGEEFKTIILPLVRSQGRMLQRNLFYTAITRAREKVWVLGETEAVSKAIANDKVIQRNTVLRDLILPVSI